MNIYDLYGAYFTNKTTKKPQLTIKERILCTCLNLSDIF